MPNSRKPVVDYHAGLEICISPGFEEIYNVKLADPRVEWVEDA